MKFKKRLKGNITAYVMILFGMTVMLYMFGFTNTWDTYEATAQLDGENGSITDAHLQQSSNPLVWILNILRSIITENPLAIGVGIAGIVFTGLIGWLAHVDMSIFYQYIIPALIIGFFLNVIVFPVTPEKQLQALNIAGMSLSVLLIVFFNLFYILAVIDFVRGK